VYQIMISEKQQEKYCARVWKETNRLEGIIEISVLAQSSGRTARRHPDQAPICCRGHPPGERACGSAGGAINHAKREWQFEGAAVCDGYDPEANVFQVRQRA
jgi:hypothetical protein